MSKEQIRYQLERLDPIINQLKKKKNLQEKLSFLSSLCSENHLYASFLDLLNFCKKKQELLVVYAIIIIGQAPNVFNISQIKSDFTNKFSALLKFLIEIEDFYKEIGGIIGYHAMVLHLILQEESNLFRTAYSPPPLTSLDSSTFTLQKLVKEGICQLDRTAIFLPIGGAGDRLNLTDAVNQAPLPAALLPFLGFTLLEGIIRDLSSYEHLFKLFHTPIHLPIVLMTSEEKNNHYYILKLLEEKNWLKRPKESLHILMQPLSPVITEEGHWSLKNPLELYLKPGGHGVIWKIIKESKTLKKLIKTGNVQAGVRQINNPLAGLDGTFLALLGAGFKEKKSMGFISCERPLYSAEGVNVLVEESKEKDYFYTVSNIEYPDFTRKNIEEVPLTSQSPYSSFPSNTNILYINLKALNQALQKCTLPGALINMKTLVPFIDINGNKQQIKGGRLESTMQNIADYMQIKRSKPLSKKDFKQLKTFALFSPRFKTISPTKKAFIKGQPPIDTPEQAYYDLQLNNYQLFKEYCHFYLPDIKEFEDYLATGPACQILYHPALGPLYSIICQKIRGGQLAKNSELKLEIAEVDIENLKVTGSLHIDAIGATTHDHFKERTLYQAGRCTLKNVEVNNKGIDLQKTNNYWKNQFAYLEKVTILLQEGAEFYGENLLLKGSHHFEVPAFHRLIVTQNYKGQLCEQLCAIQEPSWYWQYSFDCSDKIMLTKVEKKSL